MRYLLILLVFVSCSVSDKEYKSNSSFYQKYGTYHKYDSSENGVYELLIEKGDTLVYRIKDIK